MEQKDVENIIGRLSDALNLKVTEEVYEQTKHKDKEISALHREIREDIKFLKESFVGVKSVVDSHDEFIKEVQQIIKTSGYIRKFFLWILVFVPSVSAFIAGLKYIYDSIKNTQ